MNLLQVMLLSFSSLKNPFYRIYASIRLVREFDGRHFKVSNRPNSSEIVPHGTLNLIMVNDINLVMLTGPNNLKGTNIAKVIFFPIIGYYL